MKFVNKKKLEFKQGFFVVKDKVMTNPGLVKQVNKLQYLDEVLGFIESNRTDIENVVSVNKMPTFEDAKKDGIRRAPNTTALDDYVDQMNAVLDDVQALGTTAKVDEILSESFSELLEFVRSDDVLLISSDYYSIRMYLNPLELTEELIENVVEAAVRNTDLIAAVDKDARRKIPELWN